jgi:hypothetical protein
MTRNFGAIDMLYTKSHPDTRENLAGIKVHCEVGRLRYITEDKSGYDSRQRYTAHPDLLLRSLTLKLL